MVRIRLFQKIAYLQILCKSKNVFIAKKYFILKRRMLTSLGLLNVCTIPILWLVSWIRLGVICRIQLLQWQLLCNTTVCI